jgi:hypothetical protein
MSSNSFRHFKYITQTEKQNHKTLDGDGREKPKAFIIETFLFFFLSGLLCQDKADMSQRRKTLPFLN